MNIIFLSIGGLNDLNENAVYPDLLRFFKNNGHSVYVVCQREQRLGMNTAIRVEAGINVLRVRTGNITKTNLFEKGISTLAIGRQFKKAVERYFCDVKFDLILYSTPPITLVNVIKHIKKRDGAKAYLMLKDIFPQNAIDIGLLSKKNWKVLVYIYFRDKEKNLYKISDYIGCMSEANLNYVIRNNKYIDNTKIEICPNTIDPAVISPLVNKAEIRSKFHLPEDKVIFIYGGNFGKPQNIDFIMDVLRKNKSNDKIHFLMIGSGTDFYKIKNYSIEANSNNLTVMDTLDKFEYSELLSCSDVGLIFLDYRFTIPNFPSRMLDYMNYELPILAATDSNTDVRDSIEDGGFGWWCESNNIDTYNNIIDEIVCDIKSIGAKGENGKKYLFDNYRTEIAYNKILSHFV